LLNYLSVINLCTYIRGKNKANGLRVHLNQNFQTLVDSFGYAKDYIFNKLILNILILRDTIKYKRDSSQITLKNSKVIHIENMQGIYKI